MEDFAVGVLPNDNPITVIMQSGYNLGYDTGYRAGLEAAQPKWISVENPPKEAGEYIVAAVTHANEVIKTWDIFEPNSGWCGDLGEFKKVLYYMPFESLPEPPEVET